MKRVDISQIKDKLYIGSFQGVIDGVIYGNMMSPTKNILVINLSNVNVTPDRIAGKLTYTPQTQLDDLCIAGFIINQFSFERLNNNTITDYKFVNVLGLDDIDFNSGPESAKSRAKIICLLRNLNRFLNENKHREIIVNCAAGINRSAMLCAFHLMASGKSYDEAADMLKMANHSRRLPVLTNPSYCNLLQNLRFV